MSTYRKQGKLIQGQKFVANTGIVIGYTQRVENPDKQSETFDSIGSPTSDVDPIDAQAARAVSYDRAGIQDGPAKVVGLVEDPEKGVVERSAQVVNPDGTEIPSITVVGNVVTEVRYEESEWQLLRKVVETWTLPGLVVKSDIYDPERGAVSRDTQLVQSDGSENSSLVLVGDSVHTVTYENVNEVIRRRITELWETPGPLLTRGIEDKDKGPISQTSQLIKSNGGEEGELSLSGSTVTELRYEPVNAIVRREITEVYGLPGPVIPSDPEYDQEKGALTVTNQLVAKTGSEVADITYTMGSPDFVTEITYQEMNKVSLRKRTVIYVIPCPINTSSSLVRELSFVTRTTQLTKIGSTSDGYDFVSDDPGGPAAAEGILTKITHEPFNKILERTISESFHLPGPYLVGSVYDPFSDSQVTESTQVVFVDKAEPSITNLFSDFHVQAIDQQTKRFVIRTYPSGITSQDAIVEYVPDRFVYPAIWHGLSGDSEIVITPPVYIESERPLQMSAEHSTIFTTTEPGKSTVMASRVDLLPIRHSYHGPGETSGVRLDVETGPVLADSFTIDGIEFPASSPTASAYLTARAAGSWLIQNRQSKKLAKGLWAVTTISIPYL